MQRTELGDDAHSPTERRGEMVRERVGLLSAYGADRDGQAREEKGRRSLRVVARRRAGAAGKRSAAAYERAAVELAFLERRIARGQADGHRHAAERHELRRRFLAHEDDLRRAGVLPGPPEP